MALSYFRRSQPVKPKTDAPTSTESESPLKPTESQQEKVDKAREFGASLGAAPAAQQDVPPPEDPVPREQAERQERVLTDEDEQFLERLVSQAEAEPIQPDDEGSQPARAPADDVFVNGPPPSQETTQQDKKRKSWFAMPEGYSISSFARMPSFKRQKSDQGLPVPVTTPKESVAKQTEPKKSDDDATEEQKERNNINNILNRLHLDTDTLNNRAISISDDSKKLLNDFNQLVKDVISGAPYAYDDLEAFFKHRHAEIEKLYEALPPFMQSFVKSLPTKLVTTYAPELAVAAGMTASGAAGAKGDQKGKKQDKGAVPTLKRLVGQRGAIATMLRSSMSFLETRFPLLLGWTNVLISLALFLLMFIFYYCWKRGYDERVARDDVEKEIEEAAKKPLDPEELEEGPSEPIEASEESTVTPKP